MYDQYYTTFEHSFKAKHDKEAILLLDNASSHKKIENILCYEGFKLFLVYMPASTTPVLQPADQNLICKMKKVYRQTILQKRTELNQFYEPTFCDGVKILDEAYRTLTKSNVMKAFETIKGALPNEKMKIDYNKESNIEIDIIPNNYIHDDEIYNNDGNCEDDNEIIKICDCGNELGSD